MDSLVCVPMHSPNHNHGHIYKQFIINQKVLYTDLLIQSIGSPLSEGTVTFFDPCIMSGKPSPVLVGSSSNGFSLDYEVSHSQNLLLAQPRHMGQWLGVNMKISKKLELCCHVLIFSQGFSRVIFICLFREFLSADTVFYLKHVWGIVFIKYSQLNLNIAILKKIFWDFVKRNQNF